MSTGYNDSDSLTHEVQLLDNAVDELRNDLRRLDDRVDAELNDLRTDHDTQLSRITDDLADATATADSAATAVKKLADRVEWLSRHVRLGHGATEADLDSVGGDTARDLAAAAAGRQAAATLLTADRRRALQATVDVAEATKRRWQDTTEAVVTHSRGVAITPADASRPTAFRDAASRYRAAVTAYRTTTADRRSTTTAADRARDILTTDDQQLAAAQPTITAGETADTRARTRLRTRIADALSSEALLPEWFVITLGFRPTNGTATSTWMDLATDVLAYRITYNITSHTDALGPHPTDDPERTRWHQRVRRSLTIR